MISNKKDNTDKPEEKGLDGKTELDFIELGLTAHGLPRTYFQGPEEKYGITIRDDALIKRITEQMSNQHFIKKTDMLIEMLNKNIKKELEEEVNTILNTRHLCGFYGINYANPTNEEIKKILYMLFYKKYLSKISPDKIRQFSGK